MQDFFQNVSRYPRYLISFTLGILLTAISPLLPLFKRPTTAIVAISFLIAAFAFLSLTLRAMLGLDAG
jgi:heme/copper-type cytochrome/quinol oxidase subunit 4